MRLLLSTHRGRTAHCVQRDLCGAVCSETCVGRMRYLGVILYDADKIDEYASANTCDLVDRQRALILDPNDAEVIAEAERQGISHNYILAAQRSPTYKLMKEWAIAFLYQP